MLHGEVVDELQVAAAQRQRQLVRPRREVHHVDGLGLRLAHGRHVGPVRRRLRAGDRPPREAEAWPVPGEEEEQGAGVPECGGFVPMRCKGRD